MSPIEKHELLGISKFERAILGKILRNTQVTISTKEAAKILNIPSSKVAKFLAELARKGWLLRISRGIYTLIPLESKSKDIVFDDLFVIATKLFNPCYIGGWSAAQYWEMTDQIFQSVVVLSEKLVRDRKPIIRGNEFIIRTVKSSSFFGLKTVWLENVKVLISDRERTLLDMLIDPKLGGGIRPMAEVLINYMNSEYKNIDKLIEYIIKLGNGAVCKRLGFLIENYFPNETSLLKVCVEGVSAGNAKLDNSLECNKLVTRWCLWVPNSWKTKNYDS